jgi:hypothetical protein
VCFDFLYVCLKTFLNLIIIQQDIIKNVHSSARKVPSILVRFLLKLAFLDRFSKNSQISNLMKIRPMGAELLLPDTKKMVVFRKFANAPKISLAALQRTRVSDTCHVSLMKNRIHVATGEVFTGRLGVFLRYEITVTCEPC